MNSLITSLVLRQGCPPIFSPKPTRRLPARGTGIGRRVVGILFQPKIRHQRQTKQSPRRLQNLSSLKRSSNLPNLKRQQSLKRRKNMQNLKRYKTPSSLRSLRSLNSKTKHLNQKMILNCMKIKFRRHLSKWSRPTKHQIMM